MAHDFWCGDSTLKMPKRASGRTQHNSLTVAWQSAEPVFIENFLAVDKALLPNCLGKGGASFTSLLFHDGLLLVYGWDFISLRQMKLNPQLVGSEQAEDGYNKKKYPDGDRVPIEFLSGLYP